MNVGHVSRRINVVNNKTDGRAGEKNKRSAEPSIMWNLPDQHRSIWPSRGKTAYFDSSHVSPFFLLGVYVTRHKPKSIYSGGIIDYCNDFLWSGRVKNNKKA